MDRFVVGTGRCGSTLLSRMLAESPQVLSLFEFFGGLDLTLRFSPEPMEGKDVAALISREQPVVTAVLSRGYTMNEVIYPFGPKARYRPHDPLPWILVGVLPRLTDDPDSLFDEVVRFASSLPQQHLALHYRQLFDWLTQRLGREVWIERSGSSIELLGSLNDFFPDARFLHLHRDGPEAALSMREHPAFRLAVPLIYQLPTDEAAPVTVGEMDLNASPEPTDPIAQAVRLGEIDLNVPRDATDPISRILASRPPVEYFGRYWTDQIVHGFRDLRKLDAHQYLEVCFEDLIARPTEVLRTISDFFALDPQRDAWIERGAALIHGTIPTRFEHLPGDDQERLARACRVGSQLLGRSD